MSTQETPPISVVMSVYNGLPYLYKAIDSILAQTFTNFEFIIIDDCSDDGSSEVLEKYALRDGRIKLLKNRTRMGLGANLRGGVKAAHGEWIARMDADDISINTRLERQYDYVKLHPETDIVGSFATDIDENGKQISERKVPTTHNNIVKYIWACPIIHPTAFIRKFSLMQVGSYGTEKRRQDYALWFRCAAAGLNFANIPEPLLKYRFTDDYFKKNDLPALLTQVKIGWKGCWQVKASPIGYIGVTVPLIKGILPKGMGMAISRLLKKFDPRDKRN